MQAIVDTLVAFATWIKDLIQNVLNWVFTTLEDFGEWLLDALLFVPRFVFHEVTEFILPHINSSNSWVAGQLGNVSSAFANVPGGVWWLVDVVQLDVGLSIIFAAYGIRFIIRRLPIIG